MSTEGRHKEFGARLRQLRKQAGLTQARLAEAADISCVYVNKLERGLAVPSLDVLGRLAKSLDTDAAGLLSSGQPGQPGATAKPGNGAGHATSPYMDLYLTGDAGRMLDLVFQDGEPPMPPLPSAERKTKG